MKGRRRFTFAMNTIMTAAACVGFYIDVRKENPACTGKPRDAGKTSHRRCVTTVASCIGWNMSHRFGDCATWVVLNVAGCAVLWRSFENTVDVTSLASNNFMRPTERVPRAQVIKLGTRLLRYSQTSYSKLKAANGN
jgi:hypothetical protein